MTKRQLLNRLGMTESQLAALLGVTRAAVNNWPNNKPIPPARDTQLRQLVNPELFGTTPSTAKEAK